MKCNHTQTSKRQKEVPTDEYKEQHPKKNTNYKKSAMNVMHNSGSGPMKCNHTQTSKRQKEVPTDEYKEQHPKKKTNYKKVQ